MFSTTVIRERHVRYRHPEVRFKKLDKRAVEPVYQTAGAAGFDLAVLDELTIGDTEIVRAPTGLVIATPPEHMLYITFRSSTPRKFGITVLEGIVDSDYCGDEDELQLQVQGLPVPDNTNAVATRTIAAGTRIAQGIFVPVTHVKFVEAHQMGSSRGGFGSTG